MTAYATIANVQGECPHFTITSTSKPTTTQVQEYLDNCAGEIDAALAVNGVAVPVSSPAWFVADLESLNAMGAAARTLMAWRPDQAGPTGNGQGYTLWRQYQARLAEFRKGVGIPVGVADAEITQAPRSYFVDTGSIGSETATDDWGKTVDSAPVFTMGKVW